MRVFLFTDPCHQQVEQLLDEQPEQPPPAPDTGAETPSLFLVKEAKADSLRSAVLLHLGQEASSPALPSGRKRSNWHAQSRQTYS